MNNYQTWLRLCLCDKPEVLEQIDAEWDRLWREDCIDSAVVTFPSNEGVVLTPEIQKLIARLAGRT